MTPEQFLKWEEKSRDTIDFKRVYVHMAGDVLAGLQLSEIVYWHLPNKQGESKLRVERDGETWMARKRDEWFDRICLSAGQIDRTTAILANPWEDDEGNTRPPLIEVKTFKFGNTPTPHFRILWDNFLAVLHSVNEQERSYVRRPKPRGKPRQKSDLANQPNPTSQISQVGGLSKLAKSTSQISQVQDLANQPNLITEITTETTNKVTATADAAPVPAETAPPSKPKRAEKAPPQPAKENRVAPVDDAKTFFEAIAVSVKRLPYEHPETQAFVKAHRKRINGMVSRYRAEGMTTANFNADYGIGGRWETLPVKYALDEHEKPTIGPTLDLIEKTRGNLENYRATWQLKARPNGKGPPGPLGPTLEDYEREQAEHQTPTGYAAPRIKSAWQALDEAV